jgi:hypothetical protein
VSTNVAEWSKLDTGVGPSIASGSQRKEYTEIDLTVAVTSNSIGASEIIGTAHIGRATVRSNRSENLLEANAITEPLEAADLDK